VKMLTLFFCVALASNIVLGQGRVIVGKVTAGESGEMLPGVNVIETGTKNGTTTNPEGKYRITVSENAKTLTFSYLGYRRQEVEIGSREVIDVRLVAQEVRLSEQVVVGSRNVNRTVTETPVPVDVLKIEDLRITSPNLTVDQLLHYVAPSFNANIQSVADAADHVDPASLRGLGPDQTLVLINGKRRHTTSVINLYGSRGRGNVGTDLNTIPLTAIDRIEVLRDGAAAQYGSDAIAGVINIILKTDTDQLSSTVSQGIYTKGDGANTQVGANYGFPIAKDGFVNVTGEHNTRGYTNRAPEETKQRIGDSKLTNSSAFFNMSVPLNETGDQFYAFGGLNYRNSQAAGFYRFPSDSSRMNYSLYPSGFLPEIHTFLNDRSLSTGVRGKIKDWNVDLNNTFGVDRLNFRVENSLNASLLDQTPTSFDCGGYQFAQNTTTLDFSRPFTDVFAGINVAFGLEFKVDNYQIFKGEEASYRNYGFIDSVVNGRIVKVDVLGKAGGAQVFPGFQPANELDRSRSNAAAYVDVELDATKQVLVAAAGRFERYSDFGDTWNGKLAARYSPVPELSVRGSVSTGFRAPSLQQLYFNTTFTDVQKGQIIDKGIFNSTSLVTRALGIPPLKQETSTNFSLGFTARPVEGLSVTVDGYVIKIKDRILLTGNFDTTAAPALAGLGISQAQFFANAVNTTTKGFDVIVTYDMNLDPGKLSFILAGNVNSITQDGAVHVSPQLAGLEDTYFSERERLYLRASAPTNKINLTGTYAFDRFLFMARLVHFGAVTLGTYDPPLAQNYSAKTTTDFAVSYRITDGVTFTFGGNNIFDVYPDKQDFLTPTGDPGYFETDNGGWYEAVQMGFNGAFYFARLGIGI
jgi:iron complex outermembrane recepter protein